MSNLLENASLSFQPIVDINSGKVLKYEALSRFDYLNPPNVQERITEIEDLGLAIEMDRRTLWTVSDYLKDPAFHHHTNISVNVTGDSVSSPLFVKWFISFLRTIKNPENMSVEVTETLPISDIETCQRLIDHLDLYGVGVYLDDYGSGHMNHDVIKQLKRYRGVKIDGSIVNGWESTPDTIAVTENLFRELTGHNSNADVVAEFVDSLSRIEMAKKFGVHAIQGFGIGRPSPFPEPPNDIARRWDLLTKGL